MPPSTPPPWTGSPRGGLSPRGGGGAERGQESVGALPAAWRRGELPDTDALRARLRGMVADTLAPRMVPLKVVPPYPFVVLVVGVNGVGKTTTIGKAARRIRAGGGTVLLAAAATS